MRLAQREDLPALEAALRKLVDKSPALHMQFADWHVGWTYVQMQVNAGNVLIVGDFAVFVSITPLWFTSKRFVIEDLVLRISRESGTALDEIPAALKLLAKFENCVGVVSGDTQVGRMDQVYNDASFSLLGRQFIYIL